jgi:hypothetical protein
MEQTINDLLYDLGRLNVLKHIFPDIPKLAELEKEMRKLYEELKAKGS